MLDPAWVALSLTERIGGRTMGALSAHFNGDMQAVLKADSAALRRVPGVGKKIAEAIRQVSLEAVTKDISRWQAKGVRIITLNQPDYPPLLRQLDDAPPTLFAVGEWRAFWQRTAAVVGTRHPTDSAASAAAELGIALAERGYTVVSGLALGIDTAAHSGALTSGHTVAVLGSGVLNLYPPANHGLAQSILRRGAVVSELRPEAGPSPSNLVARNRIISGLSQVVIVVESSASGGAMYAARFARAQGRPIYALDSGAEGNQALIAAGAIPLSPDLRALPF